MGVELSSSDWPAHAADVVSASPTPGGLLDGAAGPVPANSLALLMPAKDITGIKGLADYGSADFTVPALTMDQVDPCGLVPVHPESNYLGDQLAKGPHTPIGPVAGYPEDGKNIWRAELDDQITTAGRLEKYRSGESKTARPSRGPNDDAGDKHRRRAGMALQQRRHSRFDGYRHRVPGPVRHFPEIQCQPGDRWQRASALSQLC